MPRRTFTAIDLFAGCGGLSSGLQQAGFKVLAAVERDALAASTYHANHQRTLLLTKDICKITCVSLMKTLKIKKGELDLLAGCPPCQGFSTLRTYNGGRRVRDRQNDLVFQFLRFVRELRPKTIMMENVPGLAKDPRIDRFREVLKKLGYISKLEVLNAADYGVPQRRKRMILIATSKGTIEFAGRRTRRKKVSGAIRALSKPKRSRDILHNYSVAHDTKVREMIRLVPKDGGSRGDLSKRRQLKCHREFDGFKDVYGRMSWDDVSPTITGGCINPSKGRFLHPQQNRAITLREAALLQGFPKNYFFSLDQGRYPAAQMIGNAFPPPFASIHAKQIRKTLLKT